MVLLGKPMVGVRPVSSRVHLMTQARKGGKKSKGPGGGWYNVADASDFQVRVLRRSATHVQGSTRGGPLVLMAAAVQCRTAR